MTIRTMLGLTLLGGALYAHKRHGGEFTVDSMMRSLKNLWTAMQNKASDVKDKAAQLADKAQDKVKDVAEKAKDVADKTKATPAPGGAGNEATASSNSYTPGSAGNRR